ncbi:MAG: class I SAM-dependent methyltransferase [Pseudomonadota bacterium]
MTNYKNPYEDQKEMAARFRRHGHRVVVGGMWDEVGALQLEFLKARGLEPGHWLLDVGCGALRGGVGFVKYLDAAHYYGIDINQSLLDAGYGVELPKRGLRRKMPRENLLCCDDFDASSFGVEFDFALAVSVFTHMPLEDVARALAATARVMKSGGGFYATFFDAPEGPSLPAKLARGPGDFATFGDENPFHQRPSDLVAAAGEGCWRTEIIGDWGHPRGQKMALFERL